MVGKNCVFCKIAAGEIPSKKALEMANVLAFYDRDPAADIHILIIPKRHLESFTQIKKEDYTVLSQMLGVAQDLIKEKKIEKTVINLVFIFVKSLHV